MGFENVDLDNEGDLLGEGEFLFEGEASFINQRVSGYPVPDFDYDTRAIAFRFDNAVGAFEVSSLTPNDHPDFGDKYGLNDPFAVRELLLDNGSHVVLEDSFDNQTLEDVLFAEYFDVLSDSYLNLNSIDVWINSNVEDYLNVLITDGFLFDDTISQSQSLLALYVPEFSATHVGVVPEPSIMVLLIVGAVSLLAISSRRSLPHTA